MSTAYLTSENGRLSFTNEKLVFSNREKEEVTLFPHLIDTIAVNGLLNITGAAIRFLMEKEIPPSWTNFNGRNRNPPLDVANAVFSFVYTLLSYRIETALITSGLDPAVGILHSFAYSRNSLVFDLIEEFRSPLADSVCCSLFSLKILDAKDFSFESQNDEKQNKAVYLTKNGIGKVIERFEKKLMKKIQVAGENRKMTYDSLIKYQAMQYKNCVMTGTIYNPVYIR